MDQVKRGVKYFCYLVFLLLIVYLGYKLQMYLSDSRLYPTNPYLLLYFYVVFPMIVGMLFGLPFLMPRFRKDGGWNVDWVIIISICLPTFVLSILPVIYYNPSIGFLLFKSPLKPLFNIIISEDSNFLFFTGVIFGFSIIYSIKGNQGDGRVCEK